MSYEYDYGVDKNAMNMTWPDYCERINSPPPVGWLQSLIFSVLYLLGVLAIVCTVVVYRTLGRMKSSYGVSVNRLTAVVDVCFIVTSLVRNLITTYFLKYINAYVAGTALSLLNMLAQQILLSMFVLMVGLYLYIRLRDNTSNEKTSLKGNESIKKPFFVIVILAILINVFYFLALRVDKLECNAGGHVHVISYGNDLISYTVVSFYNVFVDIAVMHVIPAIFCFVCVCKLNAQSGSKGFEKKQHARAFAVYAGIFFSIMAICSYVQELHIFHVYVYLYVFYQALEYTFFACKLILFKAKSRQFKEALAGNSNYLNMA